MCSTAFAAKAALFPCGPPQVQLIEIGGDHLDALMARVKKRFIYLPLLAVSPSKACFICPSLAVSPSKTCTLCSGCRWARFRCSRWAAGGGRGRPPAVGWVAGDERAVNSPRCLRSAAVCAAADLQSGVRTRSLTLERRNTTRESDRWPLLFGGGGPSGCAQRAALFTARARPHAGRCTLSTLPRSSISIGDRMIE